MTTAISGEQLKSICANGNLINAGIESADFAEVRKSLDSCITLLRKMAEDGHIDSYLIAKLTLAFTAGLAVTQQSALLSNLFELGKLFNQDQIVFEARCKTAATFDGMNLNTRLTPRDLKLLSMGMFFTCNPDNIQLEPKDTIVMLQIKLVEKVLLKLEKQEDDSYGKFAAQNLDDSFQSLPAMVFEYLQNNDKQQTWQLMAFWEFMLQMAYGNEIPKKCAAVFSEKLKLQPVVERHMHIRLLQMLPWQINATSYAENLEVEIIEPAAGKHAGALVKTSSGTWFSELPEIGRPMKMILTMHFIVGMLAVGFSQAILWSGIAVTLASIFYRTCLHFKEEVSEGSAPTSALLIYLFASFMSIGAFSAEGLAAGIIPAVMMHLIFPLFFGLFLVGRRKIINFFQAILSGNTDRDNKRLK